MNQPKQIASQLGSLHPESAVCPATSPRVQDYSAAAAAAATAAAAVVVAAAVLVAAA